MKLCADIEWMALQLHDLHAFPLRTPPPNSPISHMQCSRAESKQPIQQNTHRQDTPLHLIGCMTRCAPTHDTIADDTDGQGTVSCFKCIDPPPSVRHIRLQNVRFQMVCSHRVVNAHKSKPLGLKLWHHFGIDFVAMPVSLFYIFLCLHRASRLLTTYAPGTSTMYVATMDKRCGHEDQV